MFVGGRTKVGCNSNRVLDELAPTQSSTVNSSSHAPGYSPRTFSSRGTSLLFKPGFRTTIDLVFLEAHLVFLVIVLVPPLELSDDLTVLRSREDLDCSPRLPSQARFLARELPARGP